MPTWYIVAGPTGGVNKVYAHHGVDGGSPGCWARDFDAEYAPALFGYTRCSRAKATAQRLVDTGRGDPQSPHIFVVPRERLFELLEVKDWSRGGRG